MATRVPLPDREALLRRLRAAVLATDALLDEVESRYGPATVARESVALARAYTRDTRWTKARELLLRRAAKRAHATISGIRTEDARPWNTLATLVLWAAQGLHDADGRLSDRTRRNKIFSTAYSLDRLIINSTSDVFAWLGSTTPMDDAVALFTDAMETI